MWKFWEPEASIEAEFDIEGRDVFVVERHEGMTLFGYMQNGEPRSWAVKTTDDDHRCFVERLTLKIRKRQSTATASAHQPNPAE